MKTQTHDYQIGDMVTENTMIVPPGRKPWIGIIAYVDKKAFSAHRWIKDPQDLVGVLWMENGEVEALPASVLVLVQKVLRDEKEEEKA